MNFRSIQLLLLVSCLGLTACASGIKRQEGVADYKYQGEKFAGVSIKLTPAVQEKLKDDLKFNQQQLSSLILRGMEAQGLMDGKSSHLVDIEITDVRVRSTFNAVMFGFMAGNDRITGNIALKQIGGVPRHSFEVSASYALGGLGGGQDQSRMNWLYEEFAKLTVQEIKGGPEEGAKTASK